MARITPTSITTKQSSARLLTPLPLLRVYCGGLGPTWDRRASSSVGNHQLAGQDGASSRQTAKGGGDTHPDKNCAVDSELHNIGSVGAGECLPENKQDSLRSGHGPDGSIEITALPALSLSRAANTRQDTKSSQSEDKDQKRRVSVSVDLLHVPLARGCGHHQTGQIEQREIE